MKHMKAKKTKRKTSAADVEKADIQAYMAVQRSGLTSMRNRSLVCEMAGISEKTYNLIIKGYSRLLKKYRLKL